MIDGKKSSSKAGKVRGLKILENLLFILSMIIIISLILITVRTMMMGQEPSILGHRLYIVDSGSMSPTLKLGALIIVREMEADEISVDDIITYKGSEDSVVTHRVTEIEGEGSTFITKGDANKTDDPMPLDSSKLIGKVIFVIPYIGFLLKLIRTKVGLILMVTLILAGVITQILGIREDRESKRDVGMEIDEDDIKP